MNTKVKIISHTGFTSGVVIKDLTTGKKYNNPHPDKCYPAKMCVRVMEATTGKIIFDNLCGYWRDSTAQQVEFQVKFLNNEIGDYLPYSVQVWETWRNPPPLPLFDFK